ncbi:hypothetical protein M977_04124 [Buttiauxella gaviniae ATCC 51604]|uniref:Uncharacterized protein n=1 Tax=Buttiauxella gaviniae ATCC 51604 TaxID=1354253 RepID=A0A1B7HP96_9ENTR|nr:hypothetical protein [Buttiauxella gaviniae]OAT17462.1 hypothetical protein M977_04124 [Buttiauxella gaviniae ATCC 51604]
MKVNEELPATGYAVIRCQDCAVVARFDCFPDKGRILMYRNMDVYSFMPLSDKQIIISPESHKELISA